MSKTKNKTDRKSGTVNSMNTNTVQNKFPITLFVYGTLKTGYWNFERYCRNAVNIKPATVWGRLWQLPAGYPAIEVPEASILAYGTGDPLKDAVVQKQFSKESFKFFRHDRDWGLVRGEVMSFLDPHRDLPLIDQLEGFNPSTRCLYNRVLVPALQVRKPVVVWLYQMHLPVGGVPIPSGIWDQK